MWLSGKDLRVLPGALMIYLHVPFSRVAKGTSEIEDAQLEELYERVIRTRKAHDPDQQQFASRADLVAARLDREAEIDFSRGELTLLAEVIGRVVSEWGDGPTMCVYFNGDEYGVAKADFENLLVRLLKEKSMKIAGAGA